MDIQKRILESLTEIKEKVIEMQTTISQQAEKLNTAIKALEIYTDDTQYCARCGGDTYNPENGDIARKALKEIKGEC